MQSTGRTGVKWRWKVEIAWHVIISDNSTLWWSRDKIKQAVSVFLWYRLYNSCWLSDRDCFSDVLSPMPSLRLCKGHMIRHIGYHHCDIIVLLLWFWNWVRNRDSLHGAQESNSHGPWPWLTIKVTHGSWIWWLVIIWWLVNRHDIGCDATRLFSVQSVLWFDNVFVAFQCNTSLICNRRDTTLFATIYVRHCRVLHGTSSLTQRFEGDLALTKVDFTL